MYDHNRTGNGDSEMRGKRLSAKSGRRAGVTLTEVVVA